MSHRRSRKTTAIFLFWVVTLFWCLGMVYPVNGELGINTYEIVDLQVLDTTSEETERINYEEGSSEVQDSESSEVHNTVVENAAPPQEEPDIKGVKLITIKAGETLSGVAYKYQTTIAELVKLNNIQEPNTIMAGQKIRVPVRGDTFTVAVEPSRGRAQVTDEELELLARVIHAEARGEDFQGQIAVGAVVLNRVEDHRFPNTIHEVIYQLGAFTAVIDKQIHLTPNQSAYRAAEAALNGEDPTDGAIYYYNPRTATDRWIKTRPVVKTIGNHTFSI